MALGQPGEAARPRSPLPARHRDAAWWDALIATLQDAFYVVDDEGRIVEVNEAFRTILGYGPEELPFHRPYPWWPDPGRDPEAHRAVVEGLGRASGRAVLPMVHRDGRRVWMAVAFSNLVDPATGRANRVGTFRDVTAEHDAAERLRDRADADHAARAAAEQVSARLQGLVHGLAAVVWEADARTREMSFISDRAEELFGHPVQSWLADPGFWPSVVHPADRDAVLERSAVLTAAGADYELVYRMITAAGTTVWLRDLVHVLPGADGEPERLQGVMIDVTEQRRTEQAADVLAEVGGVQAGPGTLVERLDALARAGVPVLSEMAVVSLLDADGLVRPVAVVHPARPELERSILDSPPYRLPAELEPRYRAGRPFVVQTPSEALLRSAADDEADVRVHRELGIRTGLDVPLVAGDRLLGTLAFVSVSRAREHDSADLDLAAELGRRAALMIEAERLATREHRLGAITAALAGAGTGADAARVLVDGLVEAFDAAAAAAMILLPGQGLQVVRARGYPDAVLEDYLTMRLSDDLPAVECARTAAPVWLPDRAAWAIRYPHLVGVLRTTGTEAFGALPLVVGARVVGVVSISFEGARDFDDDERRFAMTIAALAAQAFERAALADTRREIAETLQHSLLPAALPHLDRLALAARYLPGARGAQAGGDWYEVLPLDGHLAAVVVGDVVGQGAPAAAVMGQLRSVLAAALLAGNGPAMALEHLERFARRVPGARASSVACLVLDTESGELCWAAAGHPPPLVLGLRGRARFLDGAIGRVLAAPGPSGFTEERTVLAPGSTLVLYTDGLVERRGEVIDDGLSRLAAAVESGGGASPAALLQHVLDATLHPSGPPDDVALIIARLLPAPLRLRLPARADQLRVLRRHVGAWAETAGVHTDLGNDLQLAVGEAAANAVDHAYLGVDPGSGEFAVELDHETGGELAVRVTDDGTWRPVPADNGHRGHGLRVLRALATDVVVEPGAGGTRVDFRMRPPAAAARFTPRAPATPSGDGRRATVEGTGDRLVLAGDLDLEGVTAVRAELLAALGHGVGRIELDLTDVSYLASAGVALLLEVIDEAQRRDRAVELRAPRSGHLRAVVELVGIAVRPAAEPG